MSSTKVTIFAGTNSPTNPYGLDASHCALNGGSIVLQWNGWIPHYRSRRPGCWQPLKLKLEVNDAEPQIEGLANCSRTSMEHSTGNKYTQKNIIMRKKMKKNTMGKRESIRSFYA